MSSLSMAALVTAYRKAKVDLFYAVDPRRRDVVEYEERLQDNLSDLLAKINSGSSHWVTESEFLGSFTFLPKFVRDLPKDQSGTFWSDPAIAWRDKVDVARESGVPITVDFRLMAQCSVEFHVFSTLWMLEVGTHLDARLSDSARGNRLRKGPSGGPNRLGLGSFAHYPTAYRRWRDEGLQAMTEVLEEGKSVLAVTADVTAFYHRLDPSFLLDDDFLVRVLGVHLNEDQRRLNSLFVRALRSWARHVAATVSAADDGTSWPSRGLPVGLPASAVVANLALVELDSLIEQLGPRFYGRYVDDITLVLEDGHGLTTQDAVWRRLEDESGGIVRVESNESQPGGSDSLQFEPPYLDGSVVAFANSKNKVFHLTGASGRAVVESIRATIQDRNSEWRSLANVPGDVEEIEPAIAAARRTDGDAAATLRDADELSARKAAFAIRLRDFEAYERALRPAEWTEHRREFIRVACEQMVTLPAFVELEKYFPRLVTLAAACHDLDSLNRLFQAVGRLPRLIRSCCDVGVSSYEKTASSAAADLVIDRWSGRILEQALEALAGAWNGEIERDDLRSVLGSLRPLQTTSERAMQSPTALRSWHRRMARRDLAHHPYRWSVLRLRSTRRLRPAVLDSLPLEPQVATAADALVEALRRRPLQTRRLVDGHLDAGIVFATRPPSMMDLYNALPDDKADRYGVARPRLISRILLGLRGYFGTPPARFEIEADDFPRVLRVAARHTSPIRIALAMLETDVLDAVAAADGHPNTTAVRFEHLKALIKSVSDQRERVDYLLLPELSMPKDWFEEFAYGLRRSGISLIAGIEHQLHGKTGAANQVWAALKVEGWGHNYFLYKQDKQRPAIPEQKKVLAPAGRKLVPLLPWKRPVPVVLAHGDFRFALLICSEFTNIEYRARLRGSVDAILVPEWNQDLHTFEALVESAALDVHAYIAQANTRGLGDTRMRAPMKDDWARDVVRLKGGLNDYFVIGEIDVDALRRAHWKRPPMPTPPGSDEPLEFKPLPDGFEPDPRRQVLPVKP